MSTDALTLCATVVAVEQDSIEVALPRARSCRACLDGRGCGLGLLRFTRGREVRLRLARSGLGDVQPGTRVQLRRQAGAVLHAAMIGYGLPLLGLLIGASTGDALGGGTAAVVAGLAGGAGAAWLALRLARRQTVSRRWQIALA